MSMAYQNVFQDGFVKFFGVGDRVGMQKRSWMLKGDMKGDRPFPLQDQKPVWVKSLEEGATVLQEVNKLAGQQLSISMLCRGQFLQIQVVG